MTDLPQHLKAIAMRILVLEDDKFHHSWMGDVLQHHLLEYRIVTNVAELQAAYPDGWDGYLLDHNINGGGGNGDDAARYLLANGVEPEKIATISGHPYSIEDYYHSGITHFEKTHFKAALRHVGVPRARRI